MSVIYLFSTLVNILLEVGSVIIIINILSTRFKPIISLLYSTLLFYCCGIVVGIFLENQIVKGFAIILIYTLITAVFYRGSILIKIILISAAYMLIISLDTVMFLIMDIINQYSNEYMPLVKQTIYIMIDKAILLLTAMVIKKTIDREFGRNILTITKGMQVYLFIYIADMLINLVVIEGILQNSLSMTRHIVWVASFGVIIQYIITNIFILTVIKYLYKRKEIALLEQQMALRIEHYESLTEVYRKQQKFIHDYNNHLTIIRQLIADNEHEKCLSYVNSIAGRLKAVNRAIKSNNYIVDAILNSKMLYALSHKIKFQVNVNDLNGVAVGDADLVCILSNLLDNAIEACLKIDKGSRYIKIKIHKDEVQLLIVIENSIKENEENDITKTKKINQLDHGLGLKIVDDMLKKYNAHKEIYSNNNFFKFVTILYF